MIISGDDEMSRKASNFQKRIMSLGYRGKEIFKPLNTGWIDEHTACVREWIANIFFYSKNGTTIMIDAGYSYDRLAEKMKWLDIDPSSIEHILITHQDTDHVGAVERDSDGLFSKATLYLSEIENRYMTGEVRRKVSFGFYKLPMVKTDNKKVLLKDGDILRFGDIKVEAILVPGHTWGHMVYLVDDACLFTGDTIWFGPDGGYSFINGLAEDNKLAVQSLASLEKLLRLRGLSPKVITGHTGWSDDLDFVFAHRDQVCNGMKKQKPHDPSAPYDGYDESGDTEEKARASLLPSVHAGKKVISEPPHLNRKQQIRNAYKLTGGHADFYDGMMTYSTIAGKAICRAVWNMNAEKNLLYLTRALSGVPEDFSGKLLEVPVGTGVLTMPVYRDLPNADITCLDYSENMMSAAKKRAALLDINNISFLQGDVGALPFEDETFDIVLSLNGFHAFPDKEAAYRETYRVLKKGGVFCGCFYIKGCCSRTDWFIKHLYQPKGFFTPPYETKESLLARLNGMYRKAKAANVEGIGCFRCIK